MKSKDDAVDEFFDFSKDAIDVEVPNYQEIIEAALTQFWRHAQEQAVFDHAMAVFSYQISRAIDEGAGPDVVAERIGITKEELVKRLLHPAEMTMTEVRLLAIAAGVEIKYDVFPLKSNEDLG